MPGLTAGEIQHPTDIRVADQQPQLNTPQRGFDTALSSVAETQPPCQRSAAVAARITHGFARSKQGGALDFRR